MIHWKYPPLLTTRKSPDAMDILWHQNLCLWAFLHQQVFSGHRGYLNSPLSLWQTRKFVTRIFHDWGLWPSLQSNAHHMILWLQLDFLSPLHQIAGTLRSLIWRYLVQCAFLTFAHKIITLITMMMMMIRMRMINHERTMGKPCGWVERRNAVHD